MDQQGPTDPRIGPMDQQGPTDPRIGPMDQQVTYWP